MWLQSTQFMAELEESRKVKVYDLTVRKWRDGVVVEIDDLRKRLKVRLEGNGGGIEHHWISALSQRLAPIDLKCPYVPRVCAGDAVPSIYSVLDEELKSLAPRGFAGLLDSPFWMYIWVHCAGAFDC